ncbi:hypothetical protein JCM5350_005986 [Sporobolomyces pararoseus]
MHKVQIPQRYAHLATGTWEISFLSNSNYLNWLDSFASTQPIQPHEQLVDYVRQRSHSTSGRGSVLQQPPSISVSQSNSSFPPPASSYPSSSQSTRITMNGSQDVDFSDLIDYSALGDDADTSAAFTTDSFDHSYPSTSNQLGGGNSQSNQLMNSSYSTYSAPPSVPGYPTSSSYPVASTSSLYPPVSTPYTSQVPYYTATPSLDPTSFFGTRSSSNQAPVSSTLAIQSQMIQDERNRRNAAALQQQQQHQPQPMRHFSLDPSSVSASPQPPSPPPSATTISPSMMTNSQFASSATPPVVDQPVASTSRASSVVNGTPSASTTTKKPPASSSSSTSTSSKPKSSKRSSSTGPSSSSSLERWEKVWPDVKAQLTMNRLQKAPASTAQRLLSLLSSFNHVEGPSSTLSDWGDGSDVPPQGRKEVLSEMLKYAGEEFWKALVQEGDTGKSTSKSAGVELLSFWFEGASKGFEAKKDKEKLKGKQQAGDEEAEKKRKQVEETTLVLVLQVFAKLPLAFRHIEKIASVAKRVRKITLKGDEGAVKAAANRLYEKWKKIQQDHHEAVGGASAATSTSTSSKDKNISSKSKESETGKRKSVGSDEAPAKKAKITTSTTTTTTKKATPAPSSYAPLETAKISASMSFKKKPTEAPTSTLNAMRAALNNMKKPEATTASTTKAATPTAEELGKNGKPKKRVKWNDDNLEQIKWIEKAIYGEDEAQGKTGLNLGEGEEAEENFRMMEQQEGMTLSMHLDEDDDMEEEIEWYTPIEVVIPDTEDFASLRQEPDSIEARIQTERESNLMAVDPTSTPLDSPTEPPEYTPAVPDPESRPIPLSQDLANNSQILEQIAAAQAASVPMGGFAANDQIESLLGQLNTSILPQQQQQQVQYGFTPHPNLGGIDPATLDALKGYDVDQIRQILDSQPDFKGMTVENLGLTSGAGASYAPPAVSQPYGHEPPPTPYGSSWNQPSYGTPWQPSGPPPPAAHDAYNGYVPPTSVSSAYEYVHGGVPLPSQKQSLKKGKKRGGSNVKCRFFKTPTGCDWGDKCSFIHDNS